ncbi:SGNH/GDSL hydrolase family protein [Streptomyces sp. NPDC096205]|uniref:SGNH/GDSL hydrolase family protein n=1 Tax=Streptomyces sp. NPDC096205 TaxID=3366081 RepID=UPI0038198F0D
MSLIPQTYAWADAGQPGRTPGLATERKMSLEPQGDSSLGETKTAPVGNAVSRVERPDNNLPQGWRTSADRAVTVIGDSQGLHVLVADSLKAYQWREAATLREDGFNADAWIGNVCVTGSGNRAVVAYAPRTFTNDPILLDRGAFVAVVDLQTRKVTKLREQASLAYFNPGCGKDETVALSQLSDERMAKTRLMRLDAVTGKVTRSLIVPGEATSAVPVGEAMVAAIGNRLTRIEADGKAQLIGKTSATAFRLHPDADGAVVFLDRKGGQVNVRSAANGRISTLAHGRLGEVGLAAGTEGRVFITGQPQGLTALPPSVKNLPVDAGGQVSSHGGIAVSKAVSAGLRTHGSPDPLADHVVEGVALPYRIQAQVPQTGRTLNFTVPHTTAAVTELPSPALRTGTATGSVAGHYAIRGARGRGTGEPLTTLAAVDSSSTTYDPEATCGVLRNHPNYQALQPTPNQVEWAADMAIRGELTSGWITQGGWRTQAGLGTSVSPSTMFPLPALRDAPAGSRIPAQVLLGVLTQESNLWQATHHVLPGQTGNPLIGNFYGTNIYPGTPGYDPAKYWTIDWNDADCGYGMGQQTDGMSSASRQQPGKPPALPADQQRAIALDYAANVAVAAQTLSKKWNELHTDGQRVEINDDDPRNIENWFAAVWNYNLGFNTPDATGKWGLGWLNNPANPRYPADRKAFLDNNSYADAAHPQHWPYPEKVMGWAAYPIDTGRAYNDSGVEDDSNTHGYQAAWWNNASYRTLGIKPPLNAFCNNNNGCNASSPPVCTTEACYHQYWYDANATWKTCISDCGFETLTYKTLRSEPGRGSSGKPTCSTGSLPSNALIIDDVAASVPTMRTDCTKSWTSAGTLQWKFEATDYGAGPTYEGKEDFQQVGGGFGSHFWFAHTREDTTNIAKMKVTGTWTLDRSLNQWARVLVHLPDTGAHTQQARYRIHLDANTTRTRYLNTRYRQNTWVPLGVYKFNGTPRVVLDNQTDDGTADDDIAWDAIAFQPLPAKPKDVVVAMGDSYTSGEGAGNYDAASDLHHGQPSWNACRRSDNAWPRKVKLPGQAGTIGTLADDNAESLDFQFVACSGAETWQVLSGTPVNGNQEETWGFDGNFHEKFQNDSGVLSDDTTLVLLTIGGNDAAFDKKLQDCAISGCPSEESMKADIRAAVGETEKVLTEIHQKAKNATISLMGYPLLFSRTQACSTLVSASQRVILNDMAQYFEDQQRELAYRLNSQNVRYRSPQPAFEGKRICDPAEGINGIVAGPNGEGDFHHDDAQTSLCWWFTGDTCLSRESYHPNRTGTTAYAEAFMTVGPTALRQETQ